MIIKRFSTLFVLLLVFISLMHGISEAQEQDEADWMPDENLRTAVRSALNIANGETLTQAQIANLTQLTARNANISNITGLEHATNLTELDLRDNTILDASPLEDLTDLTRLNFHGNQISNLTPLGSLSALVWLDLYGNQIVNLTPLMDLVTGFDPIHFNELHIENNPITTSTFNRYTLFTLRNAGVNIFMNTVDDLLPPAVNVTSDDTEHSRDFEITITFDESVNPLDTRDISIASDDGAAATVTSVRRQTQSEYIADVTATLSGTLNIHIPENATTDLADNSNIASDTLTLIVDIIAPEVSINTPSTPQREQFDISIIFTEPVSTVLQSALSLTSSTKAATISNWTNTDNTTYTATITPAASGLLTLNILPGVTTDGVGNSNIASPTKTVTVDMDRPSVRIGAPSSEQSGPFNATIIFSESIADLQATVVTLTGTATATISNWTTTDGITYTATITPTTSGSIDINVAENIVSDTARNGNTAATQQTVTVKLPVPVSIPDTALAAAIRFELSLTSDVVITDTILEGLTKLRASRANIGNLTGLEYATNLTYLDFSRNNISNLEPLRNLTVLTTLKLSKNGISDLSPLQNLTSLTELGLKQNSISNLTPLSGLTALRTLGLKNNEITDVSPLEELVTEGTTALQTLTILENSLADTDANADALRTLVLAGVSIDLVVDTTQPTVNITPSSNTKPAVFTIEIVFSESVSELILSEIDIETSTAAATLTDLSTQDNVTYTAEITATTSGTLDIQIPEGVVRNSARNPNTASTLVSFTVDAAPPTVTISVPTTPQREAFNVTFTFTEPITGFVLEDISFSGTAIITKGELTEVGTDRTTYTLSITPETSGNVIIDVLEETVTDDAGNKNIADTQAVTAIIDVDAPTVSIRPLTDTQSAIFTVEVVFGEEVSGFYATDVEIVATSTATAEVTDVSTQDNITYTVEITATASGTLDINIPAEAVMDTAGNKNTDPATATFTIDAEPPTVSIRPLTDTQSAIFTVEVVFGEEVSGFYATDVEIVATSTATAEVTDVSTQDNITYTVEITATASGTLDINIPAEAVMDTAGNKNTDPATATFTIDAEPPTVTIAVPLGVQRNPFDVTITFSKPVTGFTQSELSLVGAEHVTLSNWRQTPDQRGYLVSVAPGSSGDVTFDVAKGVATDLPGNLNVAAAQPQTVTVYVPVVVSIPDAPLMALIRRTLSLAPNVPITDEILQGLTSLGPAKNQGISDLTGLEYAINLNTISLARNDISNLAPLSNLTGLTTLELARNDISDLSPLSGLTGLTTLHLKQNSISNLSPLSGLTGLTTLGLQNNNITDVSPLASLVNDGTTSLVTLELLQNPMGTTDAQRLANIAALRKLRDAGVNIDIDFEPPTVSITPSTDIKPAVFTVEVVFSEVVSGFDTTDILIADTSTATAIVASVLSGDNITYAVEINATISGILDIQVAANAVTDTAQNPNAVSTLVSFTVDAVAPTVNVEGDSVVSSHNFDLTVEFSEDVENFILDDIQILGGTATVVNPTQGSKAVYITSIEADSDGQVTISIPAEAARDAAGNLSEALANPHIVTVDTTAPRITSITAPTTPQNGTFDVEIVFSEPVKEFVVSDVSVTPSDLIVLSDQRVSPDETTYTFTATPNPNVDDTVTFNIPANVASDIAGNLSEVLATPHVVKVDTITPTIASITAPTTSQREAFDVEVVFSEAVMDFVITDVSATPSGLVALSDWRVSPDETTYTFTATPNPNVDDTVAFNIPANVASDIAGNPNEGLLTPYAVKIDTIAPTVSITAPTTSQQGAFDVTITFSEIVVGFEKSEVSVTPVGSQLSQLTSTENGRVYTVTITPVSEDVVIDIKANVATDKAGNPNLAVADPETVPVDRSPVVNIPDATLASAVRRGLGLDSATPITEASMARLRTFTAPRGVSDLTGLEHATNLNNLSAITGSITDISPIRGLTKLQYLDLSQNPIGSIDDIVNLTELHHLYLDSVSISDISPVRSLTQLFTLELDNNQISDISPVRNLTSLQWLYLGNNQIVDISPLRSLTRLRILNLYDNSIIDISDLAGFTQLLTLTLANNQILDTSPLYPLLSANGGRLEHIDISVSQYPPWDVNEDGSVNTTDSTLVTAALGQTGIAIVNLRTDVNGDGMVNATDLILVTSNLDTDAGAPSSEAVFALLDQAVLEALDRDVLQTQLAILRAESDGSLKYLHAIGLLENVLASTRPKVTMLLANYPNPFNPETWIPYHLANPSNVQITIYDTCGSVIRRLDLGHQREGYYTNRNRAAYWDGRNDVGERVASGIYFYQLQTDNVSLLRKLVILK